jgi:hypothetical protein
MLDALAQFFAVYWPVFLTLTLLVFIAIPMVLNWEDVRYSLMRFGTNFPLMGKVSRLAGKPARINTDTGNREVDQTIADSFHYYYEKHLGGRDFFVKCEDYLMKVGEHNRKNKGFFLWIIIFIMVAAEAAAFGLALAPYALTKAVTPNMAIGGAIGIGILISCAALLLSEKAGHQMYSNRMIIQLKSHSAIRRKSANAQTSNDMSEGTVQQIDLINITKTYDDTGRPRYQQILNRFDPDRSASTGLPKRSFGITVAYLFFICLLAVGAFAVRAKTLEAQESEVIDNPMGSSVQMADDFPVSGGADDFPMPHGTAQHSEEAGAKSAQDRIDAMHEASLITFLILSGLFVFIQVASTYLAYVYGFVGAKSEEAWKSTKRFKNADDFARHNQRKADSIAVDAQGSLTHLAELIAARSYLDGTDDAAKNLPAIDFKDHARKAAGAKLEKSTRDMYDGQVNSYIDSIKQLNERKEWAQAKALTAELGETIRSIPEGMLSEIVMANAKNMVPQVAPPAPTPQAPAATQATEVASALAPAQGEAPVAEQALVEQAPVQAPAAPAFDAYQWGDLLALEEADLSGSAIDLGIAEKDLRRAYTLQKMKKGAVV